MNPFQSLPEYEHFVYTLQAQFPEITTSTLVVQRRGCLLAEMAGELFFSTGRRLVVYERLSWDAGPIRIAGYSYEAWHSNEKLYWYDSQPHPADPELASTHPHHKHLPPNIKYNRVPAPGLSFTVPNLPLLIQEIRCWSARA